ncbi:MAG: RHS repeat-associated core domain-containing protein [Planctomycetes bacterium]|nr:RHS repeat-associated core domain-containing protein [Planctomycetota bacterium]
MTATSSRSSRIEESARSGMPQEVWSVRTGRGARWSIPPRHRRRCWAKRPPSSTSRPDRDLQLRRPRPHGRGPYRCRRRRSGWQRLHLHLQRRRHPHQRDGGRLLADGHGSTRLLTDENGVIQAHYAYSAYGLELPVDTAPPAQPAIWTTDLRFSGEWTDADTTGLQYLRERYFDCAAGRFVITDPWAGSMREPQSLHKYLYCHGDPVNHVDPSGMVVGALAGAAFRAGGYAVSAGQALRGLGIVTFVVGAASYAAGATAAAIMNASGRYDLQTMKCAMAAQSAGNGYDDDRCGFIRSRVWTGSLRPHATMGCGLAGAACSQPESAVSTRTTADVSWNCGREVGGQRDSRTERQHRHPA